MYIDTEIRHVQLQHKPGIRLATFLVCACCENDAFHVFQIAGQEHYHLSCKKCNRTYCFMGECTAADYE